MSEELLHPSIDPETKKLAVRNATAINEGGTHTVSQVRSFPPVESDEPDTLGGTNRAPSPLELALVSLVSCDGVIIHGVAEAMRFAYSRVEFDCSGQIDVRGPKGVKGARPYFEKVDMTIRITADESEERLQKLRRNVEFRCPVTNLFVAAGVDMNVEWTRAGDAV